MSRYQSSSTRLALTNYVRTRWDQSAVNLCTSAELSTLAGQLTAPNTTLGEEAPLLHAATRLLADARLVELARSAGPAAQAQLGLRSVGDGGGEDARTSSP